MACRSANKGPSPPWLPGIVVASTYPFLSCCMWPANGCTAPKALQDSAGRHPPLWQAVIHHVTMEVNDIDFHRPVASRHYSQFLVWDVMQRVIGLRWKKPLGAATSWGLQLKCVDGMW